MSFLYPLGLLGLIAIPVLIIIYIIKNKYTEQIVSATYLWTLSEKFLKRKNPINKITGIISLILQILAVIFISFAIAHPVFVMPAAAEDFCFILDGSGSMNIMRDGKTRLDSGKEEINSLIKGSAEGSRYTLIYAGETTEILYADIEDKSRALSYLEEIQPAYTASGFTDALAAAQNYFNENTALKTYLVTDKSYEALENVTLVNVSANEENYALSEVSASLSGGKLSVTGTAYSYENDAQITVELFIDGAETAAASETLQLTKLVGTQFTLNGGDNANYRNFRVAIKEKDSLALDSEVIVHNVRYDSTFKTLVVSDGQATFIRMALGAAGNTEIEHIKKDDYEKSDYNGYGLYVFENYSPEILPRDGAVWFIKPDKSTENSGFSVQDEVTLPASGNLVFNSSSSSRVRSLLKGTLKSQIVISKYMKCGFYRNFTTALSYAGNPVVFAGSNSYGNREAVFAFSFEDSDITLSPDFVILVNNLLNFTFPSIVEDSTFYCGDTVDINVLANCDSIMVESQRGTVEYLDNTLEYCEYTFKEAGVYTITLMISGVPRTVKVFAQLPEAERFTTVSETNFVISGEPSSAKRDGRYEDLIILFIVLAVIFIADWMVYCYEQYQLR